MSMLVRGGVGRNSVQQYAITAGNNGGTVTGWCRMGAVLGSFGTIVPAKVLWNNNLEVMRMTTADAGGGNTNVILSFQNSPGFPTSGSPGTTPTLPAGQDPFYSIDVPGLFGPLLASAANTRGVVSNDTTNGTGFRMDYVWTVASTLIRFVSGTGYTLNLRD
jgi:hypothetical protein